MNTNKQDLLTILESLAPGLDAKDILEHSASFVFTGTEIRTYNDQVAARHPFTSAFTGAVEADKLLRLLRGLATDDITLDTKDGSELLITAGRAHAGLTIEATKAEWLTTLAIPRRWNPLPDNFSQATSDCLFSAAKDLTRPVLTCIHLSPKQVESCDNYRATRAKLTGQPGPEACIPVNALRAVLAQDIETWALTEGWAHFRSRGVTLSCRLFTSEPYPDIGGLFDLEGEVVSMPDGVEGLIERAHVFAEDDFAQDERLTVKISKNELEVSGRNPKGWYKEIVKCSWKGKPVSFNVHPVLFRDMIELQLDILVGETRLKLVGGNLAHIVALSSET